MLLGFLKDIIKSHLTPPPESALANQYIELLKKSLLDELYIENEAYLIYTFMKLLNEEKLNFIDYQNTNNSIKDIIYILNKRKLNGDRLALVTKDTNGTTREANDLRNITELSHTMIGRRRLDNLQDCIELVLTDKIEGDFIETGIWRGGACIFMRGVLKAHNEEGRIVWAADSFEGVPPPSRHEDEGFDISAKVLPVLAVSLDEVKDIFSRYGLLDENVKFLKGWFKDTLKTPEIKKLAILRLDGDLYESTMDALIPLYDKVTRGGFIIVDDYGSCPPCKHAIHDFRSQHGISDVLHTIDEQSVYWRKS